MAFNPYTDSDTPASPLVLNDREFAYTVNETVKASSSIKDKLCVQQGLFFTDTKDDTKWTAWENLLKTYKSDFAFAEDETYITLTAVVNTANNSEVQLVPTNLFISIVIDEAEIKSSLGDPSASPLLIDDFIICNLTKSEQDLLMAFIDLQDDNLSTAKTELVGYIKTAFTFLYGGTSVDYEQATGSDEFVGKATRS